jgi:hypothetical protein
MKKILVIIAVLIGLAFNSGTDIQANVAPIYKQGWYVGNGVADCRVPADIWCKL